MELKSNAPTGPIEKRWDQHRFDMKLVNPANKRKFDVLVVGTGLAGASAAATLAELGYNVKAFCYQDSPRRAHSIAAQGGINAAKNYQNDGDSVYRLFYDTVKGGDFRSRESNVYRLAQVSVNIIDQAVAQGVPFAREYGGLLANRSFGGAQVSRTFYARGQTGQQLLLGAYSALSKMIAAGKVALYTRHEMLPDVSERMERETGYKSFYYGNFNGDMTKWGTYSHLPRFGASYVGLRNRVAVLSEAYAYATFEDRVKSTLAFARGCMEKAVEDRSRIIELCAHADAQTIEKGRGGGDEFGIRYEIAKFDEPVTIEGYEMERPDAGRAGVRAVPTDTDKDYEVEWWGRFEPTLTVERPLGYLIPDSHAHVVEKLRQHGIEVEKLEGRIGVTAERYTVQEVERARREYQNVRQVLLECDAQKEWIAVGEGWWLVRTAQPLGDLAVYLLEPESDDGLARWDLVEPGIEAGDPWPVVRVLAFSQ